MNRSAVLVLSLCATTVLTWSALSATQRLVAGEDSTSALSTAEAKAPKAHTNSDVLASESKGEFGLLAIGVGLAVLGGAIGTGLAQKSIGTAVVAACAENRGFLGIGVFLLALPETILIIATGIAYLLLQHIR